MLRLTISVFAVALAITSSASTMAEEAAKPGQQVELSMSDDAGDVGYLLYLPRKYQPEADTSWPVVLFLHGRGESYGPLDLVTKWGPPKFAKRGDDLPFILVSPQCPRDGRWSDDTRLRQLDRLLNLVTKTYRIDENRVYLTGLSMGGYGSWSLAARYPQRFAAVVPICGGGDPLDAEKLKSVPIWVFHGDQDGSVPISRSEEMVAAIRKAGGAEIRFTSLEHVGHNSWSSAYALPELYAWILKHHLLKPESR